MSVLFYASGAIAVIAALLVVLQTNAVHALISLVVVLLAIASVFFTLGAPFLAVLQIVVYAGAIMVLFVFVVLLLNLGRVAEEHDQTHLGKLIWVLPAILAAALLALFVVVFVRGHAGATGATVGPIAVGQNLYTVYLLGVELASILLTAALVAAFHFGAFLAKVEGDDE